VECARANEHPKMRKAVSSHVACSVLCNKSQNLLPMLTTALAIGAMLTAAAFSCLVLERYWLKRRPQDLAWTISLALFALGAGSLAWGSATGWNSPAFRLYYACGAIVNVPFLAAGQLYLLVKRRTADRIFRFICLLGTFAFGLVFAEPFRRSLPSEGIPQGKLIFGPGPRILAAVGSGVSALVVFIGTILGAISLLKARRALKAHVALRDQLPVSTETKPIPSRHPIRRLIGLGLLSLGVAILSLSGTLNARFGEMRAFSITLVIGVVTLFAGFILSSS
jgi:hypothetical protein